MFRQRTDRQKWLEMLSVLSSVLLLTGIPSPARSEASSQASEELGSTATRPQDPSEALIPTDAERLRVPRPAGHADAQENSSRLPQSDRPDLPTSQAAGTTGSSIQTKKTSPAAGSPDSKTKTASAGLTARSGALDTRGSMPASTGTDGKANASASAASSAGTSSSGLNNKDDSTNKQSGTDSYPIVGKMESVVFGSGQPSSAIEDRLSKLETTVFRKTYADESLFDRTERLKQTLLGPAVEADNDADDATRDRFSTGSANSMPLAPLMTGNPSSLTLSRLGELAALAENQAEVSREEQEKFALELINMERAKLAMSPLAFEQTAMSVSQEHTADLCRRAVLSHSGDKGDNPDRRYTLAGGTGAMAESLVCVSTAEPGNNKRTKAAVAHMLKVLLARQDDRDALLAPEASELGFACDWTKLRDKLYGCFEVVSKHGEVQATAHEVSVGDKIEIKGVVHEPFKFERITVAWEANKTNEEERNQSEEALPYFPPLDYVAYANRSDHDYSAAIGALKTVGVVAAIAGGMFMPPVALAAPLIVMSGGMGSSEPKPASDIPIHSGVKTDGSTFSARVPLSKDGKDGIYYVTIWASLGKGTKAVPISRRAIIASTVIENVAGTIEEPNKHERKKKKHKDENN